MEVRKKKWVEQNVLVDIVCDRCGRSCKIDSGYECAVLEADWGYGSRKDLEHHQAHLCEDCYDHIVRTCGIKVQRTGYAVMMEEYAKLETIEVPEESTRGQS